ncbi:hypothetical protein CNMCM8694_003926 [Aspergillus lentulus]|nr:hypothetical protein CNMCM8060_003924 [Aspergillus lentulus]KAF4177012.1 hypothetical protein CNMCM7927_003590 [Aspergillus lentulus]KAF4189916.1 hypothetical protein CNMCM8694_003926 [Aspergillus lentulus]
MEVRCKLCQRRGHKEGDRPSRAGPSNAQNSTSQADQSPQRRCRKEGMKARDRRRVRRQQQQQQHLEETREENVQLHLQLQQLSHGLEELRGENAQLREVGRQLYLEMLDGRLQQSQRPVEGHDDEKEEDRDQYPGRS